MPFDDNNEMLSAVVLLIETDWDVEKCIDFLSQYDEKSNMIKEKHGDINKLLKYYS